MRNSKLWGKLPPRFDLGFGIGLGLVLGLGGGAIVLEPWENMPT